MGRVLQQLEIIATMTNDSSSTHNYQSRANAIQQGLPTLYMQVTREGGSFFDQHVTFFDR